MQPSTSTGLEPASSSTGRHAAPAPNPGRRWSRRELLVAFDLYFQMQFSEMRTQNPKLRLCAKAIGRTPGSVRMKLYTIASLDPSAVSAGISGLRNASSADREMWLGVHGDWEAFAVESGEVLRGFGLQDKDDASSKTPTQQGADRQVSVTDRDGQSFFRRVVRRIYGSACCITGMRMSSMLDAAHIIPWSKNTARRCDPRNGLLLTSLHHRAFDEGLLTIGSDFRVKVSPTAMNDDSPFMQATMLQYDGKPMRLPAPKYQPLKECLEWHRTQVFQS